MAKFQQKANQLLPPPATTRADGDAPDVSTGVTDMREGAVQTAPLQPSSPRGWFVRTWQHLYALHLINGPDEITMFAHGPSYVKVRLTGEQEYLLSKERI